MSSERQESGSTRDAQEIDRLRSNISLPLGASPKELVELLYAIPRDIVSDGFDVALEALGTQIPMTTYEYPTGMECLTWIIPEKWICKEARLETLDGQTLFSYDDCPLHVVSYSLPFEGEVGRDELMEHLHVHPSLPDAVPFVHKYYERNWGLCCSKNLCDSLKEKKYRVVIRTSFSPGHLKVGEIVLHGESDESIVFCAHLCHPAQVNDDMAGVATGIEVMRRLRGMERRRYTYRLLLLPETIGSAAWLAHNENIIYKIKGGVFLEMLATHHHHELSLSLKRDSLLDAICERVLRKHDPDVRVTPFMNNVLNDERMFNSPGIRVPMLSLSRVLPREHKLWPYREYHSSLDVPENANFENLDRSIDIVMEIAMAIEESCVPVPLFKGEIFTSRFNLLDYGSMYTLIHSVPYHLDGEKDIQQIADLTGFSVEKVEEFLVLLQKEGLIAWKP